MWTEVRVRLRADDADAFDNWLKQLELVGLDDGVATLSAPTRFLQRWVETHFLKRLLARWQGAGADVDRIKIVVRSLVLVAPPRTAPAGPSKTVVAIPPPTAGPPRAEAAAHDAMRFASPLLTNLRFETFIAGASNALALTAAKSAIGADPARRRSMNPLYIHSSVGLGKTHILQAIAAAATGATYLTAERFCTTVAAALRRNGSFSAPADILRSDIVAIDDVQFICGSSLRREFARLVERLMEDGRQVVIASDRPPAAHDDFDERLRSRLSGGLCVMISRMEHELRCAVLAQRIAAAAVDRPGFAIPEEVVAMIAERVTRDGRDLEGAVNRMLLLAQTNGTIELGAAELAIEDLFRQTEPKPVLIETIQRTVALHFNASRHDMVSQRRTACVVRPRQIAMYLAKEMTPRSLPEIGRRFGGRDHTTVLHAVRKIGEQAKADQDLADELEKLKGDIRGAGR
jgi:chromosomal replication initiator protein